MRRSPTTAETVRQRSDSGRAVLKIFDQSVGTVFCHEAKAKNNTGVQGKTAGKRESFA